MIRRSINSTILLTLILCSIVLLQGGRTWALEASEQLVEEDNNSLRGGGRDLRKIDCSNKLCPALLCEEGCTLFKPQGQCCDECKCKGNTNDRVKCGKTRCAPGLVCCNVSLKFHRFGI